MAKMAILAQNGPKKGSPGGVGGRGLRYQLCPPPSRQGSTDPGPGDQVPFFLECGSGVPGEAGFVTAGLVASGHFLALSEARFELGLKGANP